MGKYFGTDGFRGEANIASVYKDFREPKDFEDFLTDLEHMAKPEGN